MHSVWFGEFMGTLVLVLLGNGVNAGVTLRKSYAADAGWMVITTGWALAVLCGVVVAQAFGSPGAHLNPAITLAAAVISGNYGQVACLLVGAVAGRDERRALMALHYAPALALTPDPAAKLGVFCTNAAVRSPLANLFSEILGTAVLVVVANAIFSHGVAMNGPAAGIGPWLVGSLVWGIGLSLGGTTGYAINPARDLGPRIVHALLPIPGQGRIELALCAHSDHRRLAGGALAGLLLHFAHLKVRTSAKQTASHPFAKNDERMVSVHNAQNRMRAEFRPLFPQIATSPAESLLRLTQQLTHSRQDAMTASAAMAAVSARTMRGPSDTARQPLASKSASSWEPIHLQDRWRFERAGISTRGRCNRFSIA
jgi:glycerol uptake facilitator protein